MRKLLYILIMFSAFSILFSGCEKAGSVDFSTRHIEVVFSPEGVGDQGYNDKILYGLQQAAVKHGLTLGIHIPLVKEQAVDIYQEWLDREYDENCERALFIFSGSEYEEILDGLMFPEDPRKDVLMFETDRQHEGIYTFNIGCYGASYLAGALSVFNDEYQEQKALIIAANPHDRNISRTVDGYRDGYLVAGGECCDVIYLSEDYDKGYNMQEEAYQICMQNFGNYLYYFSVAGASNKGVYRFSREYCDFVVGMDSDMSLFSTFIGMSVVKHIDRAINDIIESLLKNRDIPYHQNFTYSSGYEELVCDEVYSEEYFPGFTDIKNNIIEIEQRYEESIK